MRQAFNAHTAYKLELARIVQVLVVVANVWFAAISARKRTQRGLHDCAAAKATDTITHIAIQVVLDMMI
jgi:hypothetical protein